MQVDRLVRELKHKLRPENAYFKAKEFEFVLCAPKEELHQFLIWLYGDHLLPATMYEIEKALRGPETIRGYDKNGSPMYIISKKMLKQVWKRLRDRLASLDSSTSTIEVTNDYAAHFYDMYIRQHDGKHMTGDRMKILLLNMPFLLRELIAPEVPYTHIIKSYMISYTISHTISDHNCLSIYCPISGTIFCIFCLI